MSQFNEYLYAGGSAPAPHLHTCRHGRSQDFFRGGDNISKKISKNSQKYSKNFQKIFKKFSKKFKKFQKYSKNFKKFLKNFQKYFKKFSKILKNFLKKIAKNAFICIVFSQFNEARGQILRVWTKNAICQKLSKIFLRKL